MSVIRTVKDPESLALTIVAELDATPEQVWNVWEDPRMLERWWGPPSWPATFTRHDFVVGGESRYHLTGPDGEPMPEVPPMSGHVMFEAIGTWTRMTAVSRFVDVAQMETMLAMGMAEGMTEAIAQIDALLATAPA